MMALQPQTSSAHAAMHASDYIFLISVINLESYVIQFRDAVADRGSKPGACRSAGS
jgi:hypothetical protein